MSGQLDAPTALPPENSPQYPLESRLGRQQYQCEYFVEEINVSAGNQIAASHLCSLLVSLTPRLHYPGKIAHNIHWKVD